MCYTDEEITRFLAIPCLFGFFQAVLAARLEEKSPEVKSWIMTETLAFLGAYDVPLAPPLAELKMSTHRQVRGNVCLFLSDTSWSLPRGGICG